MRTARFRSRNRCGSAGPRRKGSRLEPNCGAMVPGSWVCKPTVGCRTRGRARYCRIFKMPSKDFDRNLARELCAPPASPAPAGMATGPANRDHRSPAPGCASPIPGTAAMWAAERWRAQRDRAAGTMDWVLAAGEQHKHAGDLIWWHAPPNVPGPPVPPRAHMNSTMRRHGNSSSEMLARTRSNSNKLYNPYRHDLVPPPAPGITTVDAYRNAPAGKEVPGCQQARMAAVDHPGTPMSDPTRAMDGIIHQQPGKGARDKFQHRPACQSQSCS